MTAPERTALRTGVIRLVSAWYYVVPIVSMSLFAVIPFVHAAARLRRRSVWMWAAAYGAVDAGLFTYLSVLGAKGEETSDPWGAVFVPLAFAIMITACVQLRSLRREAYGLPAAFVPGVAAPAPGDPAVAQVLAGRARRQDARALAEKDPLMARELGIGRADLGRGYDDGGLVDLATAPAPIIAEVCGLTESDSERIIEAQGTFSSVDELLVIVELPLGAWDRVRDRGLIVRA